MGRVRARKGPHCRFFCARHRLMVLLTLNKEDLCMREAMLREVKWFVQKGVEFKADDPTGLGFPSVP